MRKSAWRDSLLSQATSRVFFFEGLLLYGVFDTVQYFLVFLCRYLDRIYLVEGKELELENGKDRLLPLINVSTVICVNFIYGGSVIELELENGKQ